LSARRRTAILRVHDKVRANLDRIPVGIPEPLIVGRGIDDVAIVSLTLSPPKPGMGFRQRPDAGGARTRTELAKIDNVGLTYLVGEHRRDRSALRPIRSGSRSTA
jgi:multidrug efflux pump subunit AcrB